MELLGRERFKEEVFKRDRYRCIICGDPAVDAHHLIDRKCWPDGGYYLDNGVSLCSYCHLLAESCEYDHNFLRWKSSITKLLLPDSLCCYSADSINKWGHQLDNSIFKYPRTMHLPWSDKLQNDDRKIESLEGFDGEAIVCTEKMDGENTSLYRDYIHARSPSPITPHPSRNKIKELHDRIRRDIPEGWRVCGENLYAKHSISYKDLPGYFMVFSIWDGDTCLDWSVTKEWCELLGLPTVPELCSGTISSGTHSKHLDTDISWDHIKQIYNPETMWDRSEGYVVRVTRSFKYDEFERVVAKYVRANHVQTNQHWLRQPVVPNSLAEGVWY